MTPQTPVLVRTSERTMFCHCRQAWWWSYKEQRRVKDAWSPPLILGDVIHRSLAAYYTPETTKRRKRGPHPAQTFKKIYEAMEGNSKKLNTPVDDEKWASSYDMGIEMMEGYIDTWRNEDRDTLVLYPEMPLQLDIVDPRTGLYLCTYVGTTDCLVKQISTGRIGLLEHKTAASINTDHLFIDEQAGTYWAIIPEWLRENEVLSKPIELDLMLYNYMRKGMPDERHQNAAGQYLNLPARGDLLQVVRDRNLSDLPDSKLQKATLEDILKANNIDPLQLGAVSKSQPPPLLHREIIRRGDAERANTMQRIIEQIRDMNRVRSGDPDFPHYKSPSKECKWCEWKDLCELHESGDDWKELRKYTTKKWEPYADHVWSLSL